MVLYAMRKPILLSKNSCAMILVFDRNDKLWDVVAGVYDDFDSQKVWDDAAKEFVDQLGG